MQQFGQQKLLQHLKYPNFQQQQSQVQKSLVVDLFLLIMLCCVTFSY